MTPNARPAAAQSACRNTLLMFDYKHGVKEKADKGNAHAKQIMTSWAEAEWFTGRPKLPEKVTVTVFKVHRRNQYRRPVARPRCLEPSRYSAARSGDAEDGTARHQPDESGKIGPLKLIESLKKKAIRSPMSAMWSAPVPAVNPPPIQCCGGPATTFPTCRISAYGGYCLGGKIAPIFFNTMEDAGALPITDCDVTKMNMGDVIDIYPYECVARSRTAAKSSRFNISPTCCWTKCRPVAALISSSAAA
jgi:aconitate hydratase 2/2-methylisocitrate dehydratase